MFALKGFTPKNLFAPVTTRTGYMPYLDGMRAIAILPVVLGHFNLMNIQLARFSVTLFFFISGFLITKLLLEEKAKWGTLNLKDFYMRRLFRLYPALLFMILISAVVLLVHGKSMSLADLFAGTFYYENYHLVYGATQDPFLKVLWSLAVEEHFYLVFPLLILSGRRLAPLLAGFIVLSLCIRYGNLVGLEPVKYFKANYFTTHTRADSILYGCLAAVLIYRQRNAFYIALLQKKWTLFLGMLILGATLSYQDLLFQSTLAYSLFGLGFMLAVPAFSFAHSNGFMYRLMDNKPIIFIGKISYSLYLFHWVALQLANLHFANNTKEWYLVVFPVTIVLSLVSYYAVEGPFLKYRKRLAPALHVVQMPVQTALRENDNVNSVA
jgi:peptidoglycan/LPS O-acetylase OafA/YrhL